MLRYMYIACLVFFFVLCFFQVCWTVRSRRWGSRYKLPRSGDPIGGLRPNYVACVFVCVGSIIICKVKNKSNISDHALSHSASQRQGRAGQGILLYLHINTHLVCWFLVGPLLLAGPKKKKFNLGPNPLLAALDLNFHVYVCHVVPIHLQILFRKKSTEDQTWSMPVITQLKSSRYSDTSANEWPC